LHAGLIQSGYVIAGYELSFASFLILAGRLGDRYGRRRIFVWGMWLFVVSSLFLWTGSRDMDINFRKDDSGDFLGIIIASGLLFNTNKYC